MKTLTIIALILAGLLIGCGVPRAEFAAKGGKKETEVNVCHSAPIKGTILLTVSNGEIMKVEEVSIPENITGTY